MRLIDADKIESREIYRGFYDPMTQDFVQFVYMDDIDEMPTIEAIPVWYIIRWYEKRYRLGSTVADDWERGLLKEKIAEMYDDFKNEKYLDNKESKRYTQMVKEVIELYNDWEKENETNG